MPWGRIANKKLHQVKLFFSIFYFLGPPQGFQNFFLEEFFEDITTNPLIYRNNMLQHL